MKFIYADSLDYVDPGYNFERDEFAPRRRPYWDDVYAHEMFVTPPYDGLLVSRALMGGAGISGKYTESQAMRFVREGARKFLRLEGERFKDMLLFGDCGAFSYHTLNEPPYSPQEMVEFYQNANFSHGCSVDHIIFEFGDHADGSPDARRRHELTLDLARDFLREHHCRRATFTPIGIVQGWSSESKATAARDLIDMGYRYLAIGGLVPLRIDAIKTALAAVHDAIKHEPDVKIHLLGFAKAEHIDALRGFQVASFDSTSPLIRAFKDNTRNYWQVGTNGHLEYFAAVRVPQANENNTRRNRIKRGEISQESLIQAEGEALQSLRNFDRHKLGLDPALDAVMHYSAFLLESASLSGAALQLKLDQLRDRYRTTLTARPWESCGCEVCQSCSIEVVIFRASNRNKRRGMHNLQTFHRYVERLNREAA